MNADERIEKLLNEFGQTISDLPEADGLHHVYESKHRQEAEKSVYKWHKFSGTYTEIVDVVEMNASYICHLADVIDRMERALSNSKVLWDALKQKLQFHKTEKAEFDLQNNYMRNDIYALGYREACGDILGLMNKESPDSMEKEGQ